MAASLWRVHMGLIFLNTHSNTDWEPRTKFILTAAEKRPKPSCQVEQMQMIQAAVAVLVQ